MGYDRPSAGRAPWWLFHADGVWVLQKHSRSNCGKCVCDGTARPLVADQRDRFLWVGRGPREGGRGCVRSCADSVTWRGQKFPTVQGNFSPRLRHPEGSFAWIGEDRLLRDVQWHGEGSEGLRSNGTECVSRWRGGGDGRRAELLISHPVSPASSIIMAFF